MQSWVRIEAGERKLIESNLRGEIVEAQKSRIDLLKWKLIIVASLMFFSLPIGGGEKSLFGHLDSQIGIALVPFVCVYVDILCMHLQIRIIALGAFIGSSDSVDPAEKKYEESCSRIRGVFDMEEWAQVYSTMFICFLVVLCAMYSYWVEYNSEVKQGAVVVEGLIPGILGFSAFIGFLLAIFLKKKMKKRISRILKEYDNEEKVES